jgi:hypothetical protein
MSLLPDEPMPTPLLAPSSWWILLAAAAILLIVISLT